METIKRNKEGAKRFVELVEQGARVETLLETNETYMMLGNEKVAMLSEKMYQYLIEKKVIERI